MNIIDQIDLQNPWFRDAGAAPREGSLPKRQLYQSLLSDVLHLKQIISIIGLRRTGKSTLLKQIIFYLLKTIPSNRILYFSFDQPTIIETTDTLEDLIGTYAKKILNQEIHAIKDKVYILLDEVQLIPYWQDVVKRFYDINPAIKWLVSGSSTLFVSSQSKESLAGRIFEKYLPPLSFLEYQKLSNKNDFLDFLGFGQFPEMLEFQEISKKTEYLKEGVIGKVLEVDIVKAYGVRKTIDFERLFWSLLPNTGQIIQSSKLMTDLQLKKATLFRYLTILEQSLLINKVLNLSGSFRSEKRLLRKLYPASSNFTSLTPDAINIGFRVENYIASFLRSQEWPIYLFNQRGREIDFVIPSKKLALEVKYQENIRAKDYEFLTKFIQEKNYRGVLITKNQMTSSRSLRFEVVPVEEFEKWYSLLG